LLVNDRPQVPELAKVWRGAAHVAGAAAVIVCLGPVVEDESQQRWLQYDHGQATMSMAVAAADLGVGSSHAAVSDQNLARRLLGFPEDRFAVSLLSLGYPADRPLVPLKRPDRRPFDDVVHRGRW
jgi:nitroreductase